MRTTLALLCLFAVARTAPAGERAEDPRPNVVVFYTDDHGYADLSCQDVFDDVRTPHVDRLAADGVRALHGYSTAPQCVPSRAGLLVGKFQSRFGVEANGASMEGFDRETTIAERLQKAGYVTAQFGKWHLGPGPEITEHGFDYVFNQNAGRPFAANITLAGEDRPMGNLEPELYHVDACSRAAASVIERFKDRPLFLYVAYRAPHVPLDAPPKYLRRFPGEMPERRRQALAMLSAVDDGVGLVMRTLADNGLAENTLVFYVGDNGAPLKIHKLDAPGGGAGWDGSLNDPLNGEKGMLAEGGMHTPFVVSWPKGIKGGREYPHPISALDVAATAAAVAGLETEPGDLDGVNLVPFLAGENDTPPHDVLTWRWVAQSAIREGKWKLLRGGDREYLYDLDADLEEKHDLAAKHPEIADRLRQRLTAWAAELDPPGLATGKMSSTWERYFDVYLEGQPAGPAPAAPKDEPRANAGGTKVGAWLVRGGRVERTDAGTSIVPGDAAKRGGPQLIRNGTRLAGPVGVALSVKSSGKGNLVVSWRTTEDRTFSAANRVAIALRDADEWQDVTATLPAEGTIVHVRMQLPAGTTSIKSLQLKPARGEAVAFPK